MCSQVAVASSAETVSFHFSHGAKVSRAVWPNHAAIDSA